MWDSVLSLAENKDKLDTLLEYITEEYPEREMLLKAQSGLKNGTAFITELQYEDYIKQPLPDAVKVFLVYDNEDRDQVIPLKRQLNALVKFDASITLFDMHEVPVAGGDRNKFLLEKLGESQVVLLLLTPNFMGNPDNNCDPFAFGGIQMRKRVIPVLLEDCLWKRIQVLKDIVPLPTNGMFVSNSNNHNKMLKEIVEGLDQVIQSIKRSS
jgi:TIR domain